MITSAKTSIKYIKRKWFNRYELLLFSIFCLLGVISSFSTFSLLDGYQYNSGINLIGLFVPPVLSVFYFTIIGFKYRLNNLVLIKTLILYCIQIAPFAPLFFQVFQPTANDDFGRYYLYAKNMVDNYTLWGGDKLFFSDEGNYYVTQPGYRYFIATELFLFRDLYRFVSFVNIGILIVALCYFQKLIQYAIDKKGLQVSLMVLILLFTPYAIKNLLMGLPEWLTVVMLVMFGYLYVVRKKELAAIFILGLVPFFRQNLLIAVVFLGLWLLFNSQKRIKFLICFLIPIFLPLYHNLYYAGEWRFFVRIFSLPYFDHSSGINYELIANNILHYAGINIQNGEITISFVAVIFLPYSVLLYFILLKQIGSWKRKVIFVAITGNAIVPAILLGTAYYPRFEFVNVSIFLITYLFCENNYEQYSLSRETKSFILEAD